MVKEFNNIKEAVSFLDNLESKGLKIVERDFNSFIDRKENNLILDLQSLILKSVDVANGIVKVDLINDLRLLRDKAKDLLKYINFEIKLSNEELKTFMFFNNKLYELINRVLEYKRG